MKLCRWLIWGIAGALLCGCSTAGYYVQSVRGQMEIWRESRPIPAVLDDPDTSNQVKRKLELAMQVRRFATEQLSLPDNGSYTEYVDLNRPYMVWSVFVTPELSLKPMEWCFLVVGCVNYRGYFQQHSAQKFAQRHAEQGYDVHVGGVPAYSTLGWFDDPVPNTILHYSATEFAGFIFHELAHQVAFAKGDTVFNESFATTVEHLGVERWLQHTGDEDGIEHYRLRRQREQQVIALILEHRVRLEQMYEKDLPDSAKRLAKQELIAALRRDYYKKSADWQSHIAFKKWFDQPINNAKLIAIATYHDLVPVFNKLLQEQNGDLISFYNVVRQLAEESKSSRWQTLTALSTGNATY